MEKDLEERILKLAEKIAREIRGFHERLDRIENEPNYKAVMSNTEAQMNGSPINHRESLDPNRID